jgi:RNA-binding protein 4
MDDEPSATEAVRNLNGHSVKGRPIKVEKSESKGPRKPSQKLFIGNIAEGTTNEQLKSVFDDYACVLEADVIKNYGFVHVDANAGRQKVNEIIRELNG